MVREGLWERYEALFKNFGWDVVILKYGSLQEAAFREPGGETLRQWIDRCPNQLYSALVFQGGAAWRKRLMDEIGDQGAATKLIESRTDDELARLMNNLGGHDLPSIVEAFDQIDHDRPTCFIAYTVKGFGLPIAGHKDNHAGLMTPAQMESFRRAMNIRAGHEWDVFEGLQTSPDELKAFLDKVPFATGGERRLKAPRIAVPEQLSVSMQPEMSTQFGFGAILNELAREKTPLAERIVTTSPDVTVSTNLGPWVNRRGLFARESMADIFKNERIPSTFNWEFSPKGQHIELGIAENESVHPAVGARPVAFDQPRAAAADRHAVRSVHRARPRCAELRVLPGRPFYPRGDAIGAHARTRGRRASVDRRAADRAGPGRTCRVRAGFRR